MVGTFSTATFRLQNKKITFLYLGYLVLFTLGFTNSLGLKSYYLDFEIVNIALVVVIGAHLTVRSRYLSRLTYLDILILFLPIILSVHSWIFDSHELFYPGFYLGALLYMLLRIEKTSYANDVIGFFVLFVICIEVLVVFLQYFGFLENGNAVYKAGGTFGHPSYSLNFIVLLFPFVVFWATKQPGRNYRKIITLFIFMLLLVCVVLLQTRTAFIALMVILSFQTGRAKWLSSRMLFSCSLLVSAIIFIIKYKSSLGRLFVWINTLDVIRDNFFLGAGLGNFPKFYNRAQISFFTQHGSDNVFGGLADYIQIPYNDYLLIFAEGGLLIFSCFVAVIFFSIKNICSEDFADSFSKYLIVFFLVSSFWNVIFVSPYTMLFFGYIYFSNINLLETVSTFETSRIVYRATLALLVLTFTGLFVLELRERNMLRRANELATSGNAGKAVELFGDIFERRESDFAFAHTYVELLAKSNKFDKMKEVLETVISQTESTTFKIMLSRRLIAESQYLKAESLLLSCYNNAPKYHYTHYMLTKLYVLWSKRDRADLFYKKILDSPVSNPDMFLIRAELRSIYDEKVW